MKFARQGKYFKVTKSDRKSKIALDFGQSMAQEYILVLDQGTTSTRALLFDENFQVVKVAQQEFPQFFPQDGWVEHDPNDILKTSQQVLAQVLSQLENPSHVIGMGIANQRETTIVWDRQTGDPVYRAIVWQDRRTAESCAGLPASLEEAVVSKTGLLLDPYFSATKIKWILENCEGAAALAKKGRLLFGTVDTFLLWHLSDRRAHLTDVTNASRTCLFNIHDLTWDADLLAEFAIPQSLLPEVRQNHDHFGDVRIPLQKGGRAVGGEVVVPVYAMAGDQQAASIGQGCVFQGDVKSTYGTGCFVLANTGSEVVRSRNKLLATVAFQIQGKVSYALEGSIFNAGTMIQWLRDELQILSSAEESEELVRKTKDNEGVYFIPAFTGLGAPHWQPTARAALFGMTRACGRKQIVRACLEAAAYQTHDLLQAILQEPGYDFKMGEFSIDGGMARNSWLAQFLADITGFEVRRPKQVESTALGVAFLVALQRGRFASLQDLQSFVSHGIAAENFSATMPKGIREQNLRGWNSAMRKLLSESTEG